MKFPIKSVLIVCAGSMFTMNTLFASNTPEVIGKRLEERTVMEYWTPDRLQSAQPLPLPVPSHKVLPKQDVSTQGESQSGEGALPEAGIKIEGEHLFELEDGTAMIDPPNPIPNDAGSNNRHYTSTRLIPLTADIYYPYRTVGKLFFTIPGQGNYVCSASVLRPRVVVTAGHCVHRGSGGSNGFYTNFYFVPAFRDGSAPYQGWYVNYVQTTNAWATGGGSVPNAADYAMFQVIDKTINGAVTKIGSVTGYLGYQTLALTPNHATILAYPCNLDNCQKMHQVSAANGNNVSPNNVEYGSDMRGGSSGGPFIQNFGEWSVGQVGANYPGVNRIIGIVSYGYDSTSPKVQGSSILDGNFLTLLNNTCNLQVGNC